MGRKIWFAGCVFPFLILAIHHQGRKVDLALYGVKCPGLGEPHGNEAKKNGRNRAEMAAH
jgi:hypothetical protein